MVSVTNHSKDKRKCKVSSHCSCIKLRHLWKQLSSVERNAKNSKDWVRKWIHHRILSSYLPSMLSFNFLFSLSVAVSWDISCCHQPVTSVMAQGQIFVVSNHCCHFEYDSLCTCSSYELLSLHHPILTDSPTPSFHLSHHSQQLRPPVSGLQWGMYVSFCSRQMLCSWMTFSLKSLGAEYFLTD